MAYTAKLNIIFWIWKKDVHYTTRDGELACVSELACVWNTLAEAASCRLCCQGDVLFLLWSLHNPWWWLVVESELKPEQSFHLSRCCLCIFVCKLHLGRTTFRVQEKSRFGQTWVMQVLDSYMTFILICACLIFLMMIFWYFLLYICPIMLISEPFSSPKP